MLTSSIVYSVQSKHRSDWSKKEKLVVAKTGEHNKWWRFAWEKEKPLEWKASIPAGPGARVLKLSPRSLQRGHLWSLSDWTPVGPCGRWPTVPHYHIQSGLQHPVPPFIQQEHGVFSNTRAFAPPSQGVQRGNRFPLEDLTEPIASRDRAGISWRGMVKV